MKRTGDQDNPADMKRFAPSGFFVWRTPLLAFDELLAWSDRLAAPAALDDSSRLVEAVARDRVQLRARLHAIVCRPEVREALFVAAPDLEELIDLWASEPESERGQRIELAFTRYFVRMAGRATPFGLFAGCSLGTIGDETRLVVKDRAQGRRHTRLDMDYLFALVESLRLEPPLRNCLVYYPNTSLYRAAGRVRYVEWRLDGKRRTYHLVTVDDTEYLSATLARATAGATPAQLASVLVSEDITQAEAEAYVAELVDNQILVPSLALPVTGTEPIHALIEQLSQNPATAQMAECLANTRSGLAALDASGLGVEPGRYRALAHALEQLPSRVSLPRLFQADLVKAASEATLGRVVLEEIGRGIEILHRLFGGSRSDDLARFCEAFTARYEEQEVPLPEALDEEIGIGFPPRDGWTEGATPLLRDLALPAPPVETAHWSARDVLLLRKLCEALGHQDFLIVLQPQDLEAISSKGHLPLPDAFAVMASVAAADETALSKGDFHVLLQGLSGPSGARLLGRFCHADPALRRHVRRHIESEEALQPAAVFAEVVHLPEGRLGNILQRPLLRDYEIDYLGCSGAPEERRIPITDLVVSVRDGRVRLRSERLGHEVIPRLTTAHAFHHSTLGIYRFLASLQGQGTASGLSWDWGVLAAAPFLPRVVAGRLVLSLARWRVSREEIRRLGSVDGAARFEAVQRWRAERRLPRWVALADGDQLFPVALDNTLSVETLVHLMKARDESVMVELFQGPGQLCAHGPEGRFVHELVIPYIRQSRVTRSAFQRSKRVPEPRAKHAAASAGPVRRFTPGSRWLYAKLYTGPAIADQVLRDVISPLTRAVSESGAASHWFFVRYADPGFHLRVRFHGIPERLQGEVLPTLQAAIAPLLDDGRLWRVQLDTYEREIERYGGPQGIELAERMFHADSEAVLRIIELLEPGDEGLDERWRLAARGIDSLLEDFGFDFEGKRKVIEKVRSSFAREFRVDKRVIDQLSSRFRKERKSLEALLDPARDQANPLWPGIEILGDRSRRWADSVAQIRSLAQAGRLSASLGALVASHIHMYANRLLRSAQRAQEMVIYDFLARSYESQLARAATRDEPLALVK